MTDTERELDSISTAAADLVPALSERLRRHGLGEIEVASGQLRLRVTASPDGAPRSSHATATEPDASPASSPREAAGTAPSHVEVPSPAVGFFVYAEGLGPGLEVGKGDALGHVEMLGVRHDVRAPRGGTVRHLVAESGEAVEYGQVVVELEPTERSR